MAGDWIKMRTNLWDDTRVSQVCELVNQGEATVIGAMYWLWSMADHQTVDGVMPGLSCATIDRKTGVPGFANALVTAGWLEANADGVTITHFSDHNGASAKSRAQTAKRVANHKTNAKVTPKDQNVNASTVTGALPREEKRREEKIEGQNTSSDPAGSDPSMGGPENAEKVGAQNPPQVAAGAGDALEGGPDDPLLAVPPVLTPEDSPQPKRKKHGSEKDYEVATWMFDQVKIVNATARSPNWDEWANDIRLMREIDRRTHHDIAALLRWAQKDAFWFDKILSPNKLREKWDQLHIARNRAPVPAQKSIYEKGMDNAAKAKELLFGNKEVKEADHVGA